MIRVGQIVGAFGLKGQVKVVPLTDFLQRFEPGSRLHLNGDWVTVEAWSERKQQLVLKLSGVDDATTAENLQWSYLEAPEGEKPKLAKDEYFTADLIGLTAVTVEGEELGQVENVLPEPAHDVLVIGDLLVPAIKQFVKKVDLKGKKIVVQLIPGMREEE